MRHRSIQVRGALLAAIAGAAPAAAQPMQTPPPVVLNALAGSTLTIRGSTSVGARWHCSSSDVEARVAVVPSEGADSSALPDVRGIAVHVPVSALRCQSGPMERAMRRAIKADVDTAAQVISGRFDIADDAPPPRPNERVLYGALRVAAVEHNVMFPATVDRQADGTLHVRSRVPLALTTFGITPPRVLFGLVRARDVVLVEVDLSYPRPPFRER